MTEGSYKTDLIKRIKKRFPECMVLKNDAGYIQGIPDLTILGPGWWAVLEVKMSATEPYQPNQEWYLDHMFKMSFSATIYPENEEEVLSALQRQFAPRRKALVPKRK